MEIHPYIVTYNGMATSPSIRKCAEYLMADHSGNFGSAVARFDIYLHCHTSDTIRPGLEKMQASFQERIEALPRIALVRKAKVAEISIKSAWTHSSRRFQEQPLELSPHEFSILCHEFTKAILLIRSRLKSTDAFEIAGLERHLRHRLELLEHGAL